MSSCVLGAVIGLLIAAFAQLAIPKYTGMIVSGTIAGESITQEQWVLLALVLIAGSATQLRGYLFTYVHSTHNTFLFNMHTHMHMHHRNELQSHADDCTSAHVI